MSESNIEHIKPLSGGISSPRKCLKWTHLHLTGILRRRLLRREHLPLESIAEESWQISPGMNFKSPRAYFLPNQLERITGTAYTDNPEREMTGGIESFKEPTRGFLVKNAWLLDGSLFKSGTRNRICQAVNRAPKFFVDNEIYRGAIFSSSDGSEFFGEWLTQDCSRYLLAEEEGLPITPKQPVSRHIPQYEDWLDMKPVRVSRAFLREAVLFDDRGHNANKQARFSALRSKLLSHVDVKTHPGVFILRRNSGNSRIMLNELAMAEYLQARRGFRILDITTADLPTIVACCAGARVVAGIEGSHLAHGIIVLEPGGAFLTLQPPNRFCGVFKRMTDSQNQHYGFVVGHVEEGGFRIDPTEVERTLDLFPSFSD